MMRLRQFRMLVAGALPDPAADELFGRADDLCVEVMPAGGDLPVVPSLSSGPTGWVAWVAFDRPAPTLIDAVVSGVRDLDAAGLGIAAVLADDSLVTVETIAERCDRSVAAVLGWELPVPVGPHPRRPVYDWSEVVDRLPAGAGVAPGVDEEATLEAVALTLRVRALAPRLERMTPLRSLL
ncbi:hypothetical protein [Dactylosporangium matsuzakiense]|nr:hypothetical protein [Dactylosporangium matsuzakiense]UWZ43963.1 hypothetical protein Dmats_42200 [Dactylosporangium matsuzakiense]